MNEYDLFIKKVRTGLLFFLLLSFSSAFAGQLTEEEIGVRVREISKTLRGAVCQSESVWESGAELAMQMREIIRERVIAGESGDEIRAYFVGRYGDFILLKPRVTGLNRLIWFGPFLLLAISAALLYRKMRNWIAHAPPTTPEEIAPLSDQERQRIEEAFK